MGWISLLIIAVSLSLDAFAVAAVAAATLGAPDGHQRFRLSFHFGLFQALMLVWGWLLGAAIAHVAARYSAWIAFALLALVGGNMIRNCLFGEDEAEEHKSGDPTKGASLIMLSVATSLDALAVGVSLAMLHTQIVRASIVVGAVASINTLVGMRIGEAIGRMWGKRFELLGGLVLIALGVKILVDYLHS